MSSQTGHVADFTKGLQVDDTLRKMLRRERRAAKWRGRWDSITGFANCLRGKHRYKFGNGGRCIYCQKSQGSLGL